jgi:hypothetical protein
MQLTYPGEPRVLYRRIQEDDLILYPNFMHYRLECHIPLLDLSTTNAITKSVITHLHIKVHTYLLLLDALVAPPLICDIPQGHSLRSASSNIHVVVRTVEFCTPDLCDLGESLEEYALDSLVELGDPVFKVGIAFQI